MLAFAVLITPRILDIYVRVGDSFTATILVQDANGDPVDLQPYTYEFTCALAATFTPTVDATGRVDIEVPVSETAVEGKFEFSFALILGALHMTLFAGDIRVDDHHRAQSWAAIQGGGTIDDGGVIAQTFLQGVTGPQGEQGPPGDTGPQGPGEPDAIDAVIVFSTADLPTLVGDAYPLDPTKTYVFRDSVDLGANQLTGSVINIKGDCSIGPYACAVYSTHATATIAGSGTVIVLSLSVANFGTGSAITNSGGAQGITFGDFSAASSVANWAVEANGGAILAWQDGPLNGYAGGVRALGSIADIFMRQPLFFAQAGAPAYQGFRCDASLVAGRVRVADAQFLAVNPTDVAVSVHPSVTVAAPVTLNGCYVAGFGTPIDPAGVQKSEAKLLVTDTVGIDDSRMVGTMRLKANTSVTTFPAINTFVRIGNGTPAHTLFTEDVLDERFSISGATADAQVLTYTGLLPAAFAISADITASKTGTATVCELGIAINTVVNTDSVVVINVTTSYAYTRTELIVVLTPGDTIAMRVSNTANTNSIIVRTANLFARRVR